MITVKPETNTAELKKYLGIDGETYIYIAAKDGDELLGGGVAAPDGELLEVRAEIPTLNDGIIKSFINFFDRRNVKDLYSKNEKIFADLRRAGFKENEGMYVINTDVFFGKPCKHKEK